MEGPLMPETEEMPVLPVAANVIEPFVVVVIVMFAPATSVVGA